MFAEFGQVLDWTIGWPRLPLPLGIATLVAARIRLRQENLYDTNTAPATNTPTPQGVGPGYLTARTPDGSYNDLDQPTMGSTGTRFGRNVPIDRTYQESPERIMTPNPRLVSRELLTRDTFKPATTLNLHAAAWLQFMVHDWLSHGRNDKANPWRVPLPPDDDWPENPMQILRTRADPTRPDGSEHAYPPTYANTATHWWDASQLYGSGADMLARLRSGNTGKLTIGADNLLPLDEKGIDLTGVSGNWWIGLSLMHNLFAREHNAICDRLAAEYPAWSDDDLFNHARLINAALLAKIHTVEWTPAIIAHPTTRFALRGNWWGLEMERLSRLVGRLSSSEVVSGIPGSPTDHHGVPYAITEEFVAVYRMHPLLPDQLSFRSVEDDTSVLETTFSEVAFARARPALEHVRFTNALYSFGTLHPGAITLHNFPTSLQRLTDLDGILNDVGAIDLLRIRERGVPRYNDFRELLHKPRLRSFDELSDNPEWVAQLRRIYADDIDSVDLMIGLYAEPLPPGFGFSDTAFRIFILMASRRLKSDRFFTTDFTPRVYTQTGMDWIANNTFSTVLLRHAPGLGPALSRVDNAFAPWPTAGHIQAA
ncbi:MAG TPA: peroxidase family protein [Chloroflexota bacterium]|nr:peroxidase family protein [Chloroflexota bacterium]